MVNISSFYCYNFLKLQMILHDNLYFFFVNLRNFNLKYSNRLDFPSLLKLNFYYIHESNMYVNQFEFRNIFIRFLFIFEKYFVFFVSTHFYNSLQKDICPCELLSLGSIFLKLNYCDIYGPSLTADK